MLLKELDRNEVYKKTQRVRLTNRCLWTVGPLTNVDTAQIPDISLQREGSEGDTGCNPTHTFLEVNSIEHNGVNIHGIA